MPPPRRHVAAVAAALAIVLLAPLAAAEEPSAVAPPPPAPTTTPPAAPELSSATKLLTAGVVMDVIGVGFLAGGAVGFAQDRCSQCQLGFPQGFSVGSMAVGGGLIVSGVIMAAVGGTRRHAAHEDARVFIEPTARGFALRF